MTDRVRNLRSLFLVLTLAIDIWSVSGQAAQAQGASSTPATLPRVHLIATGGTISNKTGGRLSADDLLALIPEVGRWTKPEVEQFTNLASSQLTLEQWLTLSRRINELLVNDPGLAGVVVTSGTDTLEELAYFLDLTVRSEKPVVVVGSMRNPSTVGMREPRICRTPFAWPEIPDREGAARWSC